MLSEFRDDLIHLMILTPEDLKAISNLVDNAIAASEKRTDIKLKDMEESINIRFESIQEQLTGIKGKVAELEQSIDTRFVLFYKYIDKRFETCLAFINR